MADLGPFCRWESPSQTPADALLQVTSGEIWGSVPFNGLEPTVEAYPGTLAKTQAPNLRGIEFTTPIAPFPNSSPLHAKWYLSLTPGVLHRQKGGEDYACITATVDNHQP